MLKNPELVATIPTAPPTTLMEESPQCYICNCTECEIIYDYEADKLLCILCGIALGVTK